MQTPNRQALGHSKLAREEENRDKKNEEHTGGKEPIVVRIKAQRILPSTNTSTAPHSSEIETIEISDDDIPALTPWSDSDDSEPEGKKTKRKQKTLNTRLSGMQFSPIKYIHHSILIQK